MLGDSDRRKDICKGKFTFRYYFLRQGEYKDKEIIVYLINY
jgi:hypothetical protein